MLDDPALYGREEVFRDRTHAGQVLARLLATLPLTRPCVLAIPAGGVPVAVEVARRLDVPLDVAVVSKLTLPWNREAGYGAVAFDGTVLLNDALIEAVDLPEDAIEGGIAHTRRKVARRSERLRPHKPPLSLSGLTAVLVDDGLASGFTMKAAARACRNVGAEAVIAAAPTAHLGAIGRVLGQVDYVVSPNIRSGPTFAVADAYLDWRDVPEAEAELVLERYARFTHTA